MSDHTPGPWEAEGQEVRGKCKDGVIWTIAKVGLVLEQDEQMESNARLIAAAPEMMDALIEVRKSISWIVANTSGEIKDLLSVDQKRIKAVIAKATGEVKS